MTIDLDAVFDCLLLVIGLGAGFVALYGLVGWIENDNKNAAMQEEVADLRRIVATCFGETEGVVYVGQELHLCRAIPTGVR